MNTKIAYLIPSVEGEELLLLQSITADLNESELQNFIAVYNNRRRTKDQILISALIGFLGIAGIQRFLVGHIGMGFLYLFTGGLCCIGTIIDIVNHKQLCYEYNQKMARETRTIIEASK